MVQAGPEIYQLGVLLNPPSLALFPYGMEARRGNFLPKHTKRSKKLHFVPKKKSNRTE